MSLQTAEIASKTDVAAAIFLIRSSRVQEAEIFKAPTRLQTAAIDSVGRLTVLHKLQ